MSETHQTRAPGTALAISDTGPLISAFQSDSSAILTALFAQIYVPSICASELINHGWEDELQQMEGRLLKVTLAADEVQRAQTVAGEIARAATPHSPLAEKHIGEAQAIILAQRSNHVYDVLLLDELAARVVALREGMRLSGFPGVLLLATQVGLISAQDTRAARYLSPARNALQRATYRAGI